MPLYCSISNVWRRTENEPWFEVEVPEPFLEIEYNISSNEPNLQFYTFLLKDRSEMHLLHSFQSTM